MYRKLFAIHSWLGLLSGILLLLVALSGVTLVFMDDLDPVFYKNHFYTKDRGQRLTYDSLYTLIARANPEAQNIYFRDLNNVAEDRNVLFSYSVYKDGDEDYTGAAINPYSGAIVSRRSEREKLSKNFFGWMIRFHYSMHAGIWGELLVSILSIVFIGSLLTGLIVYRKHIFRVLSFRVKMRFKNWRLISSDLHRIVGVWALLFNLMIAVTGFWMLRYVYQLASYNKPPAWQYSLHQKPSYSIDSALRNVKHLYPDFLPAYFNIPSNDSIYELYGSVKEQWVIHADYNSFISLNSRTGDVISKSFINESSVTEKLDAAAGPLHFGMYGGWPIKLLYSFFGLSAPILSITGFLLWWRKKEKKRQPVRRQLKGKYFPGTK